MSDVISADELMTLDMEYRLTIAFRMRCECAPYLASRRGVLLPQIFKVANARGIDAVDLLAAYARRVHARHEPLTREAPTGATRSEVEL